MATNVLRPKGRGRRAGCSLRARSLTSWITQVRLWGHTDPTSNSVSHFLRFHPSPGKRFRTRFTFVSRFNLVQVLYEAFVDST